MQQDRKLDLPTLPSVMVAGTPVQTSNHLKIVGVTIDKSLSFDQHVSNICRECNFHIRGLRHIRPLLDQTSASILGCSIVNSRLDYCNAILAGTSSHNISRLQIIQNNLARVVCNASCRDSASALLRKLHWLPVKFRIDYKIAIITRTTLVDHTPLYLYDLLAFYNPTRTLRSSNKSLAPQRPSFK